MQHQGPRGRDDRQHANVADRHFVHARVTEVVRGPAPTGRRAAEDASSSQRVFVVASLLRCPNGA
jgi:hypothetical protein